MGKAGGVGEELLDDHGVFAVAAELRNDVGDPFLLVETPFLHEDPCRRGGDRLGGREYAEQAVRAGITEGLEQRQAPLPGHCHLDRRQQALVHFPAHPGQQLDHPITIEPGRFRVGDLVFRRRSIPHLDFSSYMYRSG